MRRNHLEQGKGESMAKRLEVKCQMMKATNGKLKGDGVGTGFLENKWQPT